MKKAIRRTFNDGSDISKFPFSSCIPHLFLLDRVFIFYRNILPKIERHVLNRKLDNMPNGMLVTPEYAMNSSSYDNIDFAGILAKVEIPGVIKKTAQLLAVACILLNSLTPQKGVLASSRARVNSIITGW